MLTADKPRAPLNGAPLLARPGISLRCPGQTLVGKSDPSAEELSRFVTADG